MSINSCGTDKNLELNSTTISKDEKAPSERVKRVLNYIDEEKLRGTAGPDKDLFPDLVLRILYQGSNQTGKEFAEYTFNHVENLTADGLHTLSVQNLKNGNYANAYKYIAKAVEMDPKGHAGYFGWTLLYYYRDYKKALKYLEICDELTPSFSDFPAGENIHYLKGLAHMQLNELDSADSKFSRYIEEEQKAEAEEFIDVYAFVNRGNVLFKMGKTTEAISDYQKALSFGNDNIEALYFLAKAETKLGQNKSAKKHLTEALKLYREDKKNRDVYIEYFHEVFENDILELMEEI